MLGIFPYDDTMADGMQLLRFGKGASYLPHHDWLMFPRTTDNVMRDIMAVENAIADQSIRDIGLGSNFSVSDAVHHDWVRSRFPDPESILNSLTEVVVCCR